LPHIDAPAPGRPGPGPAARVLAALGLLVALAAGTWFIGAFAPGYVSSVVLTGLWFLVVGATAVLVSRRRPGLAPALCGVFVVAVIASAFGFYWTSVRDEVVDETA